MKNWSNINIITSFLNKNKLDITCVVVGKRWINIQFLRKHLLEMFMCQKSKCVTLCRVTMMCLGLDDKTVKFRI